LISNKNQIKQMNDLFLFIPDKSGFYHYDIFDNRGELI